MVNRKLLEQLKQEVDAELERLYSLELGETKKAWHLREGNKLYPAVIAHCEDGCGGAEHCRNLVMLYFHWTTGLHLEE